MIKFEWINQDGIINRPSDQLFNIDEFNIEQVNFNEDIINENIEDNIKIEKLFNLYNDEDNNCELYLNDNKKQMLLFNGNNVYKQPVISYYRNIYNNEDNEEFVGQLIAYFSKKLINRDEEATDIINLNGANPLFPSLKQTSSNDLVSTVRLNDGELKYVFANGEVFNLDGTFNEEISSDEINRINRFEEEQSISIFDQLTQSQLISIKSILKTLNLDSDNEENIESMAKKLNLIE